MFIEMWMLLALLGAISIGIFSFTIKVVSEREFNEDLSLFYLYLFSSIFSFIYLILFSEFNFTKDTIILSLIIGLTYPVVLRTRFVSLKYLPASTYFINYRIFSSTILIFLGIFIFSERISFSQLLGILLGFFIFYLLLEKKDGNEKNKDFTKGVLYLFYGIILISILQVLVKYVAISEIDIYNYTFLNIFVGLILIIYTKPDKVFIAHKKEKKLKDILILTSIQALFFSMNGIFLAMAYSLGNMAIVYKIFSYSLIVPVGLTMFVYREKISFKKLFAFVLTIFSLWLFSM